MDKNAFKEVLIKQFKYLEIVNDELIFETPLKEESQEIRQNALAMTTLAENILGLEAAAVTTAIAIDPEELAQKLSSRLQKELSRI